MNQLTDDDIRDQKQLLSAYRRTLAHHLEQRAIHGTAYVPPSVIYGIEEARTQIRRIKRVLRDQGIAVNDHPDDEEVQSHEFSGSPSLVMMQSKPPHYTL